MKKKAIFYLGILLLASTVISCKKHDYAKGVLSPITFIGDIRNIYRGTDLKLTNENLNGAFQTQALVISDAEAGNVPEGVVVVQNNSKNGVSGIVLNVADAGNYKVGDSLQITLAGGILKKVEGSLRLFGLTGDNIKVLSSNHPTKAVSVSSYNLNLNPSAYESTLVAITSASVNPTPKLTDLLSGDLTVVNGADSIIIHTESKANFADQSAPATANFTGVLFLSQEASDPVRLKIWPRDEKDITNRIDPVDPNAPGLGNGTVLISGFVSDAKGADGNYEYIQLIATKDIDFSKTPMALVTCTNAGSATPYPGAAPQGGWASGGGRTYKFNVTEGKIKKGQFFYIGGSFKRINGPNSTSIADANWVRSIAYNVDGGDGFGSKTGGIFPNSGNAGGIAIFDGVLVGETTIPVDVVFYGGLSKTTIFDAVNNYGYRVANNDHYNRVDIATGTQQPFFFQGTNEYIIPHQSPADLGIFTKLAGVFSPNTKKWTTPRTHVFYQMSQTSSLSEIETVDVTVLSN